MLLGRYSSCAPLSHANAVAQDDRVSAERTLILMISEKCPGSEEPGQNRLVSAGRASAVRLGAGRLDQVAVAVGPASDRHRHAGRACCPADSVGPGYSGSDRYPLGCSFHESAGQRMIRTVVPDVSFCTFLRDGAQGALPRSLRDRGKESGHESEQVANKNRS